jgi:hypothetical protein
MPIGVTIVPAAAHLTPAPEDVNQFSVVAVAV